MAMRKYIITIMIFCLAALQSAAQEVTFFSAEVEAGVRQHLHIAESAAISMAQLDTITQLDLSHRGISDVRDLPLMPNLRMLDLSDNQLDDLQPLALLDSLEWLDLRFNNLKGINQLFYTGAKKLTINVGFNHIRDFSLFWTLSLCNFTLEGTGLQLGENEPFFDVFHFFADVENHVPMVCYHGLTNIEKEATLECGLLHQVAAMDGDSYKINLTDSPGTTTMATLSNGEYGDTTWVVPQKVFDIRANQEVTFDTELPETYTIEYAIANEGTVTVEGSTLRYQAPAAERNDTVYFTYYDGSRLKGFSRFYLSNQEATAISGITSADVSVSLRQHLLVVDMSSVRPGEPIAIQVVDAKGRQIVSHQSAAETTRFHQELQLPLVRDEIVIVQVKTSDRKIIKKLSVRN